MKNNSKKLGTTKSKSRKPGRPRAIPEALIPKVLYMYHKLGLGYRATARELKAEEGISANWSTVRRLVKDHPRKTQKKNTSDANIKAKPTLFDWFEQNLPDTPPKNLL